MSDPVDASTEVELNGTRYAYVRHGYETINGLATFSTPCHLCGCRPGERHDGRCPLGGGSLHDRRLHCRDCGVPIGWYHVPGCVVEHCTACGGQFISCHCDETIDGVIVDIPDEDG